LYDMERLYQVSYVFYEFTVESPEQLECTKKEHGYGCRLEGLFLKRNGNHCQLMFIGVGQPGSGIGVIIDRNMFLNWLLEEIETNTTVEVDLPWNSGLMEIRRWKLPMLRGCVDVLFHWKKESKFLFLVDTVEKSVLAIWRIYLYVTLESFIVGWGETPRYCTKLWEDYESVCEVVERATNWENIYSSTKDEVEETKQRVLSTPTLLDVICMEHHTIDIYTRYNWLCCSQ
jgi:hypothetical protein